MPKRRATRRESDAQLKKVLNAIENERARERAAFRSMVAALRNATPIERAEGCLQFWAKEIAEWGDHEAAVYLISRGNDCSTIIRTIQTNWHHQSGAWPAFSGEPNRLSVESTAMALHALHAISVPDWNQFALPAKEYLWSQQHTDGYWFESSAPDPVWLTVLTLDAIELASGGTRLTFQLGLAPSTSPLVFVAYQHNDIKWLEDLKKHLGGLVYGGTIEFFDDRQIQPGEEWDPRIRQKLMDAKIIIPLISSNFMGSKYIQTVEFPTAMAQHGKGAVTVLPVLVEECDWQGLHSNGYFLSQIQMLPRDGRNNLKPLRAWGNKKHAALAQVAREVRQLVQRRK